MNIITTTLNDGTIVLAKNYKGKADPLRYANYTQAATRVTDLLLAGIDARAKMPAGSRSIYIIIN